MKLKEFYKKAVEFAIEVDPRGKENVQKSLDQKSKDIDSIDEKEKEFFDKETLWNPYKDTRILNGDPELDIKDIMIGIDVEGPELLLADRLNSSGTNVDLVLSHHPRGKALATFYEVMNMQSDILNKFGIPINIAESLLESRIKEVERRVLPANHTRSVDIAKLLDLPYICMHTVADNHVVNFLQKELDKTNPCRVNDILDFLNSLPEYRFSKSLGAGPKVICGTKQRKCGKIFVDMTGGTEGSENIFKNLAQSGVGTIVCMHLSENHFNKAKKEHMNIIIAGHIASDNLGLNLLLDKLYKQDNSLNFIEVSGFKRVERLNIN